MSTPQLTKEQIDRIEAAQIANAVAKVKLGKSLNRHEQELIARSKQSLEPHWVQKWSEVAEHLGCSLRWLSKIRVKFKMDPELPKDRDDGRKDVNAWRRFFTLRNLWKGAETLTDDTEPSKAEWDRRRAQIDYEAAVFRLQVEKRRYVELEEVLAAMGQLLAGFRTAANMLPGSAARWLIGLKDFHAIKARLEKEVEAMLQALGRGEYLQTIKLCTVCEKVFIETGRLALTDLMQRDFHAAE